MGNYTENSRNYEKAVMLVNLERFAAAREILVDLLAQESLFPHNRKYCFLLLAHIFERIDDNVKALELYEQCISDYPNFGNAYYMLSNLYDRQNDYLKAEKYINKFIEIEPNNSGGLIHKASILMSTHRYDKAFNLLELVEDVNQSKLLLNYFRYYYELNYLEEAKEILDKGLELYPNDSKFLYWKANFSYEEGDFKSAIRVSNSLLDLNPSNKSAQKLLKKFNSSIPPSVFPAIVSLLVLITVRLLLYYFK